MLTLIFVSFLVAMLIFGLPMVASYAIAFLLPLMTSAEATYTVTDIVSWLTSSAAKTTYVSIALFVVSGNLMSKGQLTEKIFDIFAYFLGNKKACMPVVAVITCLFYGMISGSGVAVIAAVGSMVLPFLISLGYDKIYFAAMLACAGALGQLIPPSSMILQYCAVAGTSENEMFKVGAVIGLTVGAALIILTYIHCLKDTGDTEKINNAYLELKRKGFKKVFSKSIWALLSPVIILGGIFTGLLTVVEAAAISVLYAAIIALFVYKTLDFEGLWKTFVESVKSVAPLAMLLAFAVAFAKLIGAFNGNVIISNAVTGILSTHKMFLIGSILVITVLSMIMNPIALIVPIIAPIALSFGLDPIVYGAGIAALGAIGSLTPPFGMGLYVIAPIAKESPMKICKVVMPIFLLMTCIMSIFLFIPQLSEWVL